MHKITPQQPTTSQSLGALLKSARDIPRKDKGLNGGRDRLPMLTWIMFLKVLGDLERWGREELLEKKAEHGDAQFVLTALLKVPLISSHGHVGAIVKAVRGTDKLSALSNSSKHGVIPHNE